MKEIKHIDKIKLFCIVWDDLDFCRDPEKFFKAQEIMKHHKSKTLSGLERYTFISERNQIVEKKLQLDERKLSQQQQPQLQPQQCLSFSSNMVVNKSTAAANNPKELAFKLNLTAAPTLFLETFVQNNIKDDINKSEKRSFVEKYPVIEPSYQVNRFCCYRDRVSV